MIKSIIAISILGMVMFSGCSSTSDSDMREAINSGNVNEVKELASSDASYSVMNRENGKPLMEFAFKKGGTQMAEALLSTKLTDKDLEFFIHKGMPMCLRTSNQDKDYCECSLEKVYSSVKYLDIIDNTRALKEAMTNAAKECK